MAALIWRKAAEGRHRPLPLADRRGPCARTGQNQHQSDEDRSLDR
jgi:hypothetical protein